MRTESQERFTQAWVIRCLWASGLWFTQKLVWKVGWALSPGSKPRRLARTLEEKVILDPDNPHVETLSQACGLG